MGARALALPAASCFVNRRDRMAGLLQDDRAGAPPGALAAGPDVDDGMPTARRYVAWPRGWLQGRWAVPGPDSDPPLGPACAVQARPDRRPRAGVARHSDSAGRCPPGASGRRSRRAVCNGRPLPESAVCRRWRMAGAAPGARAPGSVPGRGGGADPGALLLGKCHQPNDRIAVFGPAQAHFLPDETRGSVAFDFFDQRCASEQFQLRLQPDHPPGEVFDLRLLHFHSVGLAVHLVFHLDHGRERAPDLVGDAHQATLPEACLASMAAVRRLLASMKSSASSMAAPARSAAALAASAHTPQAGPAPARSAAALAASAKAPKAASASPDWYAKAPRRINSDIGMSSFFALATMLFLSCAPACTTIRCTADVIESAPENVDMDSICTWTAYVHRRTSAGQPCA